MRERKMSFFQKIRESDEAVRKIWAVVFSTVFGVIVFVFWVFYMQRSAATVSIAPTVRTERPNVSEFLKNTSAATANVLGSGIKNIFLKITGERTVEVK